MVDFSSDGKFRYRLDINLKNRDSGKIVCVIMQNPSYANKDRADKSIQFLEKLIFKKNYNEFKDVYKIIIVNQFAYIQTTNFKGIDKQIDKGNDKAIEDAISQSDIVLIAWGVSNSYKERKVFINSLLLNPNHLDKQLFITKKHPSRGFYENFIEEYNLTP